MLQTIINIDVDFYNNKYILINAKQHDKKSRFLSVTCYNQGELYPINASEHSAYIRYRKSDDYGVFNFCEIDSNGKILVELTEQMLASDGICCADLVIVNKGKADVNVETGEIIVIDNASILSTMVFHIDVSETSVVNSDIESSYEFNGLNVALEKAEAEYTEVILMAKSYAIGNADGIRENEDYDNAKYYYEQSLGNANNARESEVNALASEQSAKISATNSALSERNAKNSEVNSALSEQNSRESEINAKNSEVNSLESEQKAKESEVNSAKSELNAKNSELNSKTSEVNARTSELNAASSENLARSYAVGGTGIRENEDINNAQYYCEVVKGVVDGLNSGFIPMGTISFSELATVEKATGFTYNISDDFVTTSDFAEGEGKQYTAGTNVYMTASGVWDCLGGIARPTATVDEIKEYLGI